MTVIRNQWPFSQCHSFDRDLLDVRLDALNFEAAKLFSPIFFVAWSSSGNKKKNPFLRSFNKISVKAKRQCVR